MLRSTIGARRTEQESFYFVAIACRVTERERNQIYRRRRHESKQQNNAQQAFVQMTIPRSDLENYSYHNYEWRIK